MLPTPRATDGTNGGPNQRGSSGDLMLPSAVHLLPTPAVNDMGAAYTPDDGDAWTAKMQAAHGNGNGHGKSLEIEAQRLRARTTWGDYAAAIARHERMLGRPAPAPTEAGPRGGQRLSPRFVEWMMCLPGGWVTDPALWADVKPGAARNAQLKALGNGVVPPQCAAALRRYLADEALFVEWMMCLPAGWITDPALWADVKPRGRSR
jgi:DNA (cytosine-5)-methyltransferase 1